MKTGVAVLSVWRLRFLFFKICFSRFVFRVITGNRNIFRIIGKGRERSKSSFGSAAADNYRLNTVRRIMQRRARERGDTYGRGRNGRTQILNTNFQFWRKGKVLSRSKISFGSAAADKYRCNAVLRIMQRRASGRGNTYGRGRNGQTIRRETSTPHRDWLGRQLLFGRLIFLCSGTRYLSMIPKSYCTLCSRIPDETLFREIGRIIKTVPVFYMECRRILLYMCRGYELRYIFRPIRSLQCCRLRYRAFPLQHLDLCGFCFLPFYIEP